MDGRHAAPTPHGDEVSPGATAARTSVDGRAAWRRLRRMGRPRASRSNLLAGLLAALLGFGIATQVRETQSQGLEDLREDELVRILDDVDQNGNRLDSQIRELERSRDELTAARGDDKAVEDAARERLDTLGILSGTVAAVGPGVVITIDDPNEKVGAVAVLDAVQELRDAGAEAIAVGDERVIASTWFADRNGELVVSGRPVDRPLRIAAIGDPGTMASALAIPGGVSESVRRLGGETAVERRSRVRVPALHDVPAGRYARTVPEESAERPSS